MTRIGAMHHSRKCALRIYTGASRILTNKERMHRSMKASCRLMSFFNSSFDYRKNRKINENI